METNKETGSIPRRDLLTGSLKTAAVFTAASYSRIRGANDVATIRADGGRGIIALWIRMADGAHERLLVQVEDMHVAADL